MLKRSRLVVITLFACALIGACSSPPPKVGPKFTGRLIVLSGGDLLEITADANSTFKRSAMASGVIEAVANPERTQLLYTTKDGITLRDLGNGDAKLLIKGDCYCLAWSPDGKHFSYKERSEPRKTKLFASDVNGKATFIWEDASADNRTVSQGSIHSPDVTGCASWVAPDKLIFDRFGPSQVKGGDVKPNTTTLATLNGSVNQVDAEKKWSVEGICKTGNAILRSPEGQILIAKNLENIKTANPTSGPCSGCRFAGFAANSCVPFFIEDSSSTSSDVFYLNPTNWQRQRSGHIGQPFSITARTLVNSGARLMVIGDAPATLLLVDTENGEFILLTSKNDAPLNAPVPIVWIEK